MAHQFSLGTDWFLPCPFLPILKSAMPMTNKAVLYNGVVFSNKNRDWIGLKVKKIDYSV